LFVSFPLFPLEFKSFEFASLVFLLTRLSLSNCFSSSLLVLLSAESPLLESLPSPLSLPLSKLIPLPSTSFPYILFLLYGLSSSSFTISFM